VFRYRSDSQAGRETKLNLQSLSVAKDMIAMHSPDVVAFSDSHLLRALTSHKRRPNLLVVCSDVPIDAVKQRLLKWCDPPFHLSVFPGPFQPPSGEGTLLLTDIAAMSRQQQIALFDWTTTARDVQIVSLTSTPLRQLVESGDFLEALFYRLNLVCLEASAAPPVGRHTN
jgi:transcriptional regulator of acetoin/glycerol metabolism